MPDPGPLADIHQSGRDGDIRYGRLLAAEHRRLFGKAATMMAAFS